MNWHSQGLIYGAAAMIHFLDIDEGKSNEDDGWKGSKKYNRKKGR